MTRPMADSLARMRERTLETDRLRMRVLESGPEDGVPVVFVHGNLSTAASSSTCPSWRRATG